MGVDRWKNGEVVAKKGQFFIKFEEMKVCSFWHANFKKGWKGVNLGILKMAGGYLGLNTMIWEFRVKIWVRYESKCCDLVGGTSNGVVKKNQIDVTMGEKIVGSTNGVYIERGDWER